MEKIKAILKDHGICYNEVGGRLIAEDAVDTRTGKITYVIIDRTWSIKKLYEWLGY